MKRNAGRPNAKSAKPLLTEEQMMPTYTPMQAAERIQKLEAALIERNHKLSFLSGWLRVTADALPEASAETAYRLARECQFLGADTNSK